jgi:integrase
MTPGSDRSEVDGIGQQSTPLNRHNFFRRCFKPLLEEAGLPRTIRFHYLRHTCSTLLQPKNVNPKMVQELLGHTNISQRDVHLLAYVARHARASGVSHGRHPPLAGCSQVGVKEPRH